MKHSGLFSAVVGAALVGNVAVALAEPSVPRPKRTHRDPIIDRLWFDERDVIHVKTMCGMDEPVS